MSKKIVIKKAGKKGKGVFASKDFKKGDIVIRKDISKLKRYSLREISRNPKLQKVSEHCDYGGYGKYVIDFSPMSHVNHSCNPNTYVEFKNRNKAKLIALKDIKKGEEITYDGTLCATDQIRGAYKKYNIYYWKMKCHCGSKNCRKFVHGDFFRLPKKIQLEKLPYIPTWTKRRYSKRIKRLKKEAKK